MSRPYKLYGYWRSSASWRVRWAMMLKKLPFDYVPVNLLKGEHKGPEHLKLNPSGLVPMLVTPEDVKIVQSLAILEYLESEFPNPPLFGKSSLEGAQIRSLCEIINADTAPLQTPRVQKRHSADADEQAQWAREWIRAGLKSFAALRPQGAHFAAGEALSAADLLLVPQIYNALRYKIDVAAEFPALMEIYDRCLETEDGRRASPEKQADAVGL
jgi:maleylacetoacetate isomerase